VSDVIDDEVWYAIWRSRMDRSLPDGARLDLIQLETMWVHARKVVPWKALLDRIAEPLSSRTHAGDLP
jgi:hypothetical protein